ncbi:uncharacterized protein LOC131272018 [Anopheles coustani]|uniref:uncharacterized protein LOC131272018 n=1 Tax=Anopheles coustani TaxID=139045 RepID=UPI00265A7DDF|nr:uncharacterized protein LOC131272018 [Anopheles coustani]XP_058129607.1 uncharacterized protein LOC131272018 [Anopheles coustani]
MTRLNSVDETTECEAGYIPSELPVDPDDSLQIAKLEWPPDNVLVMQELIIPQESEPDIAKVCRLCNVEDTTWFPFYRSDGSLRLEEKHLEIIRNLASIYIMPKYDHSAVVCAYCIMKIEEIANMKDIWQRNEQQLAKDRMPSVEPTEQTIIEDPEAVDKGAESEENKPEQTPGHESIIIDVESDDSDVEIVSIEPPAKRYITRSETVKSELIEEALSIISQQFDD